jgi:hypothetical protein
MFLGSIACSQVHLDRGTTWSRLAWDRVTRRPHRWHRRLSRRNKIVNWREAQSPVWDSSRLRRSVPLSPYQVRASGLASQPKIFNQHLLTGRPIFWA